MLCVPRSWKLLALAVLEAIWSRPTIGLIVYGPSHFSASFPHSWVVIPISLSTKLPTWKDWGSNLFVEVSFYLSHFSNSAYFGLFSSFFDEVSVFFFQSLAICALLKVLHPLAHNSNFNSNFRLAIPYCLCSVWSIAPKGCCHYLSPIGWDRSSFLLL